MAEQTVLSTDKDQSRVAAIHYAVTRRGDVGTKEQVTCRTLANHGSPYLIPSNYVVVVAIDQEPVR